MRPRSFFLVAAAAAAVISACDDDIFAVRWEENPDTTRLFALSREEPNLFSGFDFNDRRRVRVEAPGATNNWDLAIDYQGAGFVWLPPRVLGINSDAAVAALEGETFESAVRAPADTALYVSREPVPIRLGQIYVVRTRKTAGAWGTLCNYYGKIEPLDLDPLAGTVTFQYDVSGACNNRDLVPPD